MKGEAGIMTLTGLEVKPSRNGMGTFAKAPFRSGDLIWDWSNCKQFTHDQLPVPYIKDRYLQVAQKLYIGPDRGPDDPPDDPGDFMNHSCNPNCRIVVTLPLIHLIAQRDISAGEEITYDYAVTMHNDPWEMKCNCGAMECRGTIHRSSEPGRAQ
jgi:hypothetical protein